jgi:hypothetical protein
VLHRIATRPYTTESLNYSRAFTSLVVLFFSSSTQIAFVLAPLVRRLRCWFRLIRLLRGQRFAPDFALFFDTRNRRAFTRWLQLVSGAADSFSIQPFTDHA